MTKKSAQLIAGQYGEVYENYSGRGMYGSDTYGVVVDRPSEFYAALGSIIQMAHSQDLTDEEVQMLVGDLCSIRQDSLGRRTIFY